MKGPSTPTLGILVGGGPAPGINGVIHAATITAINNGMNVLGIYEGFKSLIAGKITAAPLTIDDVSRIYRLGGSVLRTARANPTTSEADLSKCVNTLLDAGVTHLVGIGGDDTAFSVRRVTEQSQAMGRPIDHRRYVRPQSCPRLPLAPRPPETDTAPAEPLPPMIAPTPTAAPRHRPARSCTVNRASRQTQLRIPHPHRSRPRGDHD